MIIERTPTSSCTRQGEIRENTFGQENESAPSAAVKNRSGASSATNVTPGEWKSIDQVLNTTAMMGSGSDLGFIIYAMQIKQLDNQVSDALKEIQNTSSLREALSTRLNELREIKDTVQSSAGNDKESDVSRTQIYNHFYGICKGEGLSDEEAKKQSIDKTNALADSAVQMDFLVNSQTGEVTKKPIQETKQTQRTVLSDKGTLISESAKKDEGKSIGGVKLDDRKTFFGTIIDDGWRINANEIETEINRIKDQAQKLDSDRETKMIMLNQQLNKKEQAVTQLTNILKKTDDTNNAIIQNLK